jgi:hypothetical protein
LKPAAFELRVNIIELHFFTGPRLRAQLGGTHRRRRVGAHRLTHLKSKL